MTNTGSGFNSLGWLFLRYTILLVAITMGMVAIDRTYFDFPVGKGEAGIEVGKGSALGPPPYGSEIVVNVNDTRDPLKIVLWSRDRSVQVTAEVFDPANQIIGRFQGNLVRSPFTSFFPDLAVFYAGVGTPGTYTLKVVQESDGRVRIDFFQGPFMVRMVLLPVLAAFALFLLHVIRRKRGHREEMPNPTEKPATPPPAIPAPQA